MYTTIIDLATTSKTKLVDAAADGVRRIRVLGFVLTCSADQSALFTSEGGSSTTICPALSFPTAAGPFVLPLAPQSEGQHPCWFACAAGESLHITLSSATATKGILRWTYAPGQG